jgi:hypothetical protein
LENSTFKRDHLLGGLPYSSTTPFPSGTTRHFVVSDSSATALSEVSWFAFGIDAVTFAPYTGGPHLGANYNPGFEGVNANILEPSPMPVPEPSTYAMIFLGMGLIAAAARRKRQP